MRKLQIIFIFILLISTISVEAKNPPTEMSPRLEISIVLSMKYPSYIDGKLLYVSVDRQKLYVLYNNEIIKEYDISTSKYGTGEKKNSNKTPLGLHIIASKVGEDDPINTIYKSRVNTGKKAVPNVPKYINDDLITTRIMWLEGGEEKNSLGQNSSLSRYIYIHGTPDEMGLGYTASHGCIRMKNSDIIGLFEYVDLGTPVLLWQNDASYDKTLTRGLKREKKRAKKLDRKRRGYSNLRINY